VHSRIDAKKRSACSTDLKLRTLSSLTLALSCHSPLVFFMLSSIMKGSLQSKRSIRRAKTLNLKGIGLEGMPNAVSMLERADSFEDKAVPGD